MKVESLKDLHKLIALCRKTGVESISVDGIELKLGSAPVNSTVSKSKRSLVREDYVFTPGGVDDSTPIEMPDELTDDQLLFYSAQGHEPSIEG